MNDLCTFAITLVERKLTDGSPVYTVCISTSYVEAVTYEDAMLLAEKVSEAIAKHTNETPRIFHTVR